MQYEDAWNDDTNRIFELFGDEYASVRQTMHDLGYMVFGDVAKINPTITVLTRPCRTLINVLPVITNMAVLNRISKFVDTDPIPMDFSGICYEQYVVGKYRGISKSFVPYIEKEYTSGRKSRLLYELAVCGNSMVTTLCQEFRDIVFTDTLPAFDVGLAEILHGSAKVSLVAVMPTYTYRVLKSPGQSRSLTLNNRITIPVLCDDFMPLERKDGKYMHTIQILPVVINGEPAITVDYIPNTSLHISDDGFFTIADISDGYSIKKRIMAACDISKHRDFDNYRLTATFETRDEPIPEPILRVTPVINELDVLLSNQ